MNKRMNKSKHHNTYIYSQQQIKQSFVQTYCSNNHVFTDSASQSCTSQWGHREPEDEEDHDDTP